MSIIFGATVNTENRNESNLDYDVIGKSSEVFTSGDIVNITSGVLKVAAATDVVSGVVAKTQTMASDNQTNAKIVPGYVPADPQTIFLMGTNADLTGNATDGGTYYKLTGVTGAQQVDVTSGVQTTTSRIVEIVQVDPRGIGGTGSGSGVRECLIRFVKTPWLNVGGPA